MSRSNRYCSVPQCSSWEKKSSSINFHAFPQTGDKYRVSVEGKLGNKVLMDRQKAWQLKLKIGKPVTRNMKVCSLHFIDDDYFYRDSSSTQRRFLKKTAVPSRNLPVESTTTKEKPESSSSRFKRLRQRSINKEKLVTEECSREEIKRSVQTPSQDEIEVAQGLLQLRQDFPEIQKNMPKCFECDAMSSCVLKFSKILPEANIPVKGSTKAAGYDLKSAVECVVPPRGKALVDTGLVIELPERCYGRVAPRSGLAVKSFIDVGAGVIDEDYRGPLKVVLFNHGEEPFTVNVGDRIAQLICERIYYPELQEVDIRNW